MTHDAVRRRIESGRLHRVHKGVFAVGHAGLSVEGKWTAAVLACGTGLPSRSAGVGSTASAALDDWGAAVSHRSAAELWGLLRAANRHVHVSAPGTTGRKSRRAVHIHRSRTLTPEMVTIRRGVPVTLPARTIADLRLAARTHGCPAAVTPAELRRAIRQAAVLGLAIDMPEGDDRTRSELERMFLRLCRRHGISKPEVNVRVDSFLVDFLWPDRRLIVETDGYRFHRGREAFEDDRERDLRLKSLGYEVVRLTYRQVADESPRIAETLKALLGR